MVSLYFVFTVTQHYTTSLSVLKYLLLLTCIREMRHLQDSHTVITSYLIYRYWQGSVGSIYYPMQALGVLTLTSKVCQHVSDNINVPFTWQSQKAFKLVNLWILDGNLKNSVLLWNFMVIWSDILDSDMVESPSGRRATFLWLNSSSLLPNPVGFTFTVLNWCCGTLLADLERSISPLDV